MLSTTVHPSFHQYPFLTDKDKLMRIDVNSGRGWWEVSAHHRPLREEMRNSNAKNSVSCVSSEPTVNWWYVFENINHIDSQLNRRTAIMASLVNSVSRCHAHRARPRRVGATHVHPPGGVPDTQSPPVSRPGRGARTPGNDAEGDSILSR